MYAWFNILLALVIYIICIRIYYLINSSRKKNDGSIMVYQTNF